MVDSRWNAGRGVILWPSAPDSIPVHWNLKGDVDRYGGKFEGLLLLPLISVGLYGLLLAIPQFDPGRANYQLFRSTYDVIRLAVLLFLAVVHLTILLVAFGHPVQIGTVIPLATGFLFILLGNYLGKIRPNWFIGVRTPWTLSSRRSWNKTNRLGGWFFVLIGLAVGLCGIIQSFWALIAAGIVTIVLLVWLVIYSYLVWRSDPEKLSPGAIRPASDDVEPL